MFLFHRQQSAAAVAPEPNSEASAGLSAYRPGEAAMTGLGKHDYSADIYNSMMQQSRQLGPCKFCKEN